MTMKKYFLWLLVLCWAEAGLAQKDLYDLERMIDIHLYFEEEDWAARLDSLKDARQDERLRAAVVVDGKRYEGVGVRYKGNSSFHNVRKLEENKLPFNIKIDYEDPAQHLPGGYTTLKLSNVFRDPSFLREVLSYEVAGRYMPAPRANYARVYVNEAYLGLYNSSESIDKKFLAEHYGYGEGVLIKCDPDWRYRRQPDCPVSDRASLQYLGEDTLCYKGLYELKSDTGWAQLMTLAEVLEGAGDQLEAVLDVDQSLWMLAFNNALVNLDSYSGMLCHNYYLYQDTFGQFHPIVWDMNLSLGGFRHVEEAQVLSNQELAELSPFLHFRNDKRPLIRKLLAEGLYRKIYVAHLRTIYEDYLADEKLKERARTIQRMIAPYVEEDSGKLYSYVAFQQNLDQTAEVGGEPVIGLWELMGKRREYLAQHPLLRQEPPSIEEVAHERMGEEFRIECRVLGAEKVWLYHRRAGKENFQRAAMTLEAGDGEPAGERAAWVARIPAGAATQYYLVAEGEKAAALSPKRASREFHLIK